MTYLDVLAAALTVSLASTALWRALAVDVVTRRLRERVWGDGEPEGAVRHWLKTWGKCPWCAGAWCTALVTALVDHFVGMPAPVLVFAAARFITGWLGSRDEDYQEQTMRGDA